MDSSLNKEYLVKLNHVCFDYGFDNVLEDISFQINHGDFLVILGPNGSGKTTLVKIILGLLKPKKGKVKIMGKSVQRFTDWEKIGYVSQKSNNFGPHFPASVREVVAMGYLSGNNLLTYDPKKEKESVDKALEHVGMKDFSSHRIGRLSVEQQRKTSMARAIVNDPEILFIDEPVSSRGLEMTDHFYDMLAHLNQHKSTAIVLLTSETGLINEQVNQIVFINKSMLYNGAQTEFFESDAFRKMMDDHHKLI